MLSIKHGQKKHTHTHTHTHIHTLRFNNIRVNKKIFHISKEPIDLMSVNIDQIVVSDKFNHYNDGYKYCIGYQEGEIVKPLCIIFSHEWVYKVL